VNGFTGSPLRRWGGSAEFAGMFRRNRRPGWSGRGEKAQRRLIGWQKLATGVKIQTNIASSQAQCRLRQSPVGGGPSAHSSSKTTNWLVIWATPQGIGRSRQPASIGSPGQPNKPINANWQEAFYWGSVGPVKFTK